MSGYRTEANLYNDILKKINEINYQSLSDETLKEKSGLLIKSVSKGASIDDFLIEAYSLVRETASRVLNMRPFNVQVIAGIAMHYGKLIEMQTGEGKTLAAVFPAFLNALTGKGVHILTFNDYLAKRDAEWMGPIYNFLGLSVGYVREGMPAEERKKSYNCDITYLTAKEAGFDYLRGFLCMDKEQLLQRPFNYAIVDEADSILIDEARIPLVIAGLSKDDDKKYSISQLVKRLRPNMHYEIDESKRNVYLTDEGNEFLETSLQCGNLYEETNLSLLTQINNALYAEALLKKDVDYIVKDDKIELIDEFTGRIAYKRRWPYGLQAALEAKEGIIGESKGQILASITLQNFINLYPKICGMTGTAKAASEEFKEFYGLDVFLIKTNKPSIREDEPDLIFINKEAKYRVLVSDIKGINKTGRPILIGTCSIEESELLSDRMNKEGIKCTVLNAKNNEQEAKVIARAGVSGSVTVSTNMAGRGTDIKLGGESLQEHGKVVGLGGLFVIGTNRHESSRIDNQLRGRAGRQGDPGGSRFYVSLEDNLVAKHGDINLKKRVFKDREALIDNTAVRKRISKAQRVIERQNYNIRRMLTKYSAILEQQRQIIYKKRMDILCDKTSRQLFRDKEEHVYNKLLPEVGEAALKIAEKQVSLLLINKHWADFFDYVSYLREGIHLENVVGKIPIDEFIKKSIDAFDEMLKNIDSEITETLSKVRITQYGIDLENSGLEVPSSTWTYIIDDSPEQLDIMPILTDTAVAALGMAYGNIPLILLGIFKKHREKKRLRRNQGAL